MRCGLITLVVSVALVLSPSALALPGANGKIAYMTQEAFPFGTIHFVNPDGTGNTLFTPAPVMPFSVQPPFGTGIAFSPDGTRLAYSYRGDLDPTGTPDWEIRAAALDGSSDVAITLGANDDQNPRFDFNPAWSPNGSELVYASECCTGGTDILVADAMVKGQGGLVAFGNVFADDPDWSPDGSAIAFDDNAQIWTARPDGSQLTLLNPSGARPRYSPDGARIAFSSTAPQAGIYVMNADGTGVALLAANGAVPTWSPDGTTIAFLRSDGIWTMSSDGSSQHRIVATGNVTSISWQPLPSPPQNYGAPLVSGVPQLGQLLTTTTGRWASFNAQAVTYTYQWQRCNSATCTNIQGATGATYIPVAADADRTLRVVVRARNLVGGSDKSSAQTGPIRRH